LVPDRAELSVPVAWLIRLSGSILSHKNMTAIYSTAVGEPNTDLDGFDVYQAYQRALADEEVSIHALLTSVFSSRHPDISPSSGDFISHGARYTF
jgi:hypothetical protein